MTKKTKPARRTKSDVIRELEDRLVESKAKADRAHAANADLTRANSELAKLNVEISAALHPSLDSAAGLLMLASRTIAQRANERDLPNGERSMARTVAAFNVTHGQGLGEVQGWLLMLQLTIARATAGHFNPDDYVDMAAYAALAGEAAQREVGSNAAAPA